MSSIVRNEKERLDSMDPFFDEGVFYPRLDNKKEEVAAARKEAIDIVQAARDEASQLSEASRQKGFEQGVAEGLEHVKTIKPLMENMIKELREYKEISIAELEPVLVKLALETARKIIKTEIQTNPAIIKKIVLNALNSIVNKKKIIICIHPDDYSCIEEYQDYIVKSFREIKHITIEQSPSIERGGCCITTERGELDATIKTQFETIADAYGQDVSFDQGEGG